MHIDKIILKNFRNYSTEEINLSDNINFFTGKNGSGKTNILEGVGVVSGIKSFRGNTDKDMIQKNKESYFCSLTCRDQDRSLLFEVGYADVSGKYKKKVKVNGKEIQKFSDYYGELLTVVFQPDDINLVNSGPENRRKYFDSLISKIDRKYLQNLTDFKRVLLSRNKCLKDIADGKCSTGDLNIWNELFAQKAVYIVNKRISFLENFNNIFSDNYSLISEEGNITIPILEYSSDCPVNELEILEKFEKYERVELLRKTGIFGPQRDDFIFKTEDDNFTSVASQGQKRTAVIALKNSEIDVIENFTGKKVIIMIDDIFSELDSIRRMNLIHSISRNNQILLTAVSIENIKDYFTDKNIRHFDVDNGKLSIINEMAIQ